MRVTVFFFLLFSLISLNGCGSDSVPPPSDRQTIRVESDVPGVYLQLPQSALPDGVSASDISVSQMDPADLPFTVDGVQLQAFELTPDGTAFKEPVQLVVPFEDILPFFIHVHDGDVSPVGGVRYELLASGHQALVPIDKFSVLVRGLTSEGLSISGKASDTLVGDAVEASATIALRREYTEDRGVEWFAVAGTGEVSGSINKGPNLSFDVRYIDTTTFDREITLDAGGYICESAGSTWIKLDLTLEWDEFTHALHFGRRIHDKEVQYIEIELPFECAAEMIVSLISVDQEIHVNAVSSRVDPDESHHADYQHLFRWEVFGDGFERMTEYSNGELVSEEEKPIVSIAQIKLNKTVSVPGGAKSEAAMLATMKNEADKFSIEGSIKLDANAQGSNDWNLSAMADALWTIAFTVHKPAEIHIANCQLFDQSTFAHLPGFSASGADCSFQITGEPVITIPDMPGMPSASESASDLDEYRDFMESFKAYTRQDAIEEEAEFYADAYDTAGIPEDPELADAHEWEEILAGMKESLLEDGVDDPDERVKRGDRRIEQADGLANTLFGQTLFLQIAPERFETNYLDPVDSLEEQFSITVSESLGMTVTIPETTP